MMISTKGRYALRIMIDLAQHREEGFISLSDIAQRQDISVKYLEIIIALLNKAGCVESMRGKKGGYRIKNAPEKYTVKSILDITEGGIVPVNCHCINGDFDCERSGECLTLPVWRNLDKIINDYLNSVTLKDLVKQKTDV